jgi:hypothetical protein
MAWVAVVAGAAGILALLAALFGLSEPVGALLLAGALFGLCTAQGVWALVSGLDHSLPAIYEEIKRTR